MGITRRWSIQRVEAQTTYMLNAPNKQQLVISQENSD